jgi:hypothetical protein
MPFWCTRTQTIALTTLPVRFGGFAHTRFENCRHRRPTISALDPLRSPTTGRSPLIDFGVRVARAILGLLFSRVRGTYEYRRKTAGSRGYAIDPCVAGICRRRH